MSDDIVVDTDVLSFHARGDTRFEFYRPHLEGKRATISFMTVAELWRWSIQRNWG